MSATATLVFALFRCPCGATFRREVERVGGNYRAPEAFHRIESWHALVMGHPVGLCKCGKWRYGREVVGTVKPDIKCGAKCRSSKGPSCDCSCGGLNHGANHG